MSENQKKVLCLAIEAVIIFTLLKVTGMFLSGIIRYVVYIAASLAVIYVLDNLIFKLQK